MNILVTGGAGFIGSHLVDAYVNHGHRVTVLDDLSSGKEDQVHPKARFVRRDILDPQIAALFRDERFDVVNHHAAQISVTRSVADPVGDAQANILGSLNLLQSAVASGVRKFIFASTGGAIYGEQETFPADERHPCRPLSPYGISKLCVEQYLQFYRKTHGLESIVFRYSNVFGPRQDPHGEAGVIAIFCQKLLDQTPPVIFGDGDQTRDFLAVQDAVQANLLALEHPCNDVYNIGTGVETTVNRLVDLLAPRAARPLSPQYHPPRPGEQKRSVLDASKFRAHCGWEPRWSLEKGLEKTFEYFAQVHGETSPRF